MKKKDLYERVVEQTGVKKREVRRVLDTAFTELRASLVAGQDIAVPPLGRIRVKTKGEGEETKTTYRFRLATEAEVEADADEGAEMKEPG